MSFIYEYHLRNAKERQDINLLDYQQELEILIKETFKRNLKETITLKKSFEFRLYVSVDLHDLQNLGKEIKNIVTSKHGFVRKAQILYAIVDNIDEDSAMISVEFVDSLVGNSELYSQRVNRFFENKDINGYSEEIKNNYYVDVYSAEISGDRFKQISGTNEVHVGDCYVIEARHRRGKENDITENRNVVELDKIFDYPYLLLDEKDRSTYASDFLIIKKTTKVDKDYKKIETTLKLTLEPAKEISALTKINNEKEIVFCVHNVGQALATSFTYRGEKPFLYFDYGVPYGGNAHTFPARTTLPVDKKNTEIIISHLDKDHWFGLSRDKDSYECAWYIPDQRRGVQLKHKVSEIIHQGGSVRLIRRNIINGKFSISCSGTSTRNSTRPPMKKHETGLALCVDAQDEFNNKCKILIEGDQDYDYVENTFLVDVNILVACHHGGKYSWTVNSDLPHPTIDNNCIIYSYGDRNTHRHPSYIDEHQAIGWTTEHHTTRDGSYKKIIRFKTP